MTARPISAIARDIKRDWGTKINYGAKPYLEAMLDLDQITDNYMADSGKSVVLYFLANAANYRGPKARELKAELKALLKTEGK